jgi:hypothetical protein
VSYDEFFRRLGTNEKDISVAMSKIDGHERVCAERYAGISVAHGKLERSIASLNSRLLGIGTMLLLGMAGILVKIVFFPGAP